MVDNEYQLGLTELIREDSLEEQRAEELVGVTSSIMKHFFERGTYGNLASTNGNVAPACWPYVRYLVADGLREKFGYGEPLFTKVNWDYQFLKDLSDEAKQLTEILPKDLKYNEWLFIVGVASHMLMTDPYLLGRGYVTENGRNNLVGQSIKAELIEFSDGDMYELQFMAWKEKLEAK